MYAIRSYYGSSDWIFQNDGLTDAGVFDYQIIGLRDGQPNPEASGELYDPDARVASCSEDP